MTADVDKSVSAYLADIGRRGGEAGKGKVKKRSKKSYREAGRRGAMERWRRAREAKGGRIDENA